MGADRPRGWNRTSLVAGLLFIVLGVLFLLESADVIDLRAVVVVPILLIGLGVAILAGGDDRP
ncbi:MAG: hypothetical protein HY658_10155 [Actinobacteria bacterium]|nr:hypothetical protein [Actinomycetota bacterium]